MTGTDPKDPTTLLARLEADPALFAPQQLRLRLDALDGLDAHFPELAAPSTSEAVHDSGHSALLRRAENIRTRLEMANAAIYRSIRVEIRKKASTDALLLWLQRCSAKKGTVASGLGYDHLDELVSGVLELSEPAGISTPLAPGMVFYQPAPVRHILRMLRLSRLTVDDVLVDLGSGLGHVPLLASILTGARAFGIEIEPEYVTAARACARALRLHRVTFVQEDARTADLSAGTVFFLYTPFTGAMLQTVLDRLRHESSKRVLRICTFGPCTLDTAKENWLKPATRPVADRITLFRSVP